MAVGSHFWIEPEFSFSSLRKNRITCWLLTKALIIFPPDLWPAIKLEIEMEKEPVSFSNDGSKDGVDMLENTRTVDDEALALKVDFRLIPILGAIYAISGIDRTNLSAARVAGMHEDLDFHIGERYSIVLLVFFVTYFLFEIPSNLILRKPRVIAWFYSVNVIANGFGSLLAYGIIRMDGLSGISGWRWIFIIEGLMTCFLAILGYFLIVDFPDKLSNFKRPFLTQDEVDIIKAQLNRDRSDAEHDEFTLRKVVRTLGRWQLWIYSLMFMCLAVGIYGYAYFTVVILQGMGYSTGRVFLLSAPPSIVSVPISIIISYFADKYRLRAPVVGFMAVMCTIGYVLVAYTKQNGVKYFGIFLGIAGANGALPAVLAWQANNIRGQSTRAVASGLQVAFGAIGGIYASLTFMEKEAPTLRASGRALSVNRSLNDLATTQFANCIPILV
ncbi:hypothetical protein FQN51_003059 [Onygenales sp. PD_10]|nr:hypothetical protein FQN51_003059 [Onygenales sp. PD_10]